jgi:hypothetical protein
VSSLMKALVRRNIKELLTRHHNKVIILMDLLVCMKILYVCVQFTGTTFRRRTIRSHSVNTS